MDRFALPFLAFCILALVIWALLDERNGDRKRAQRDKDAAKERPPLPQKRSGRR